MVNRMMSEISGSHSNADKDSGVPEYVWHHADWYVDTNISE